MIMRKCNFCKQKRPSDKIYFWHKPLFVHGLYAGNRIINYCNDQQECIEGARGITPREAVFKTSRVAGRYWMEIAAMHDLQFNGDLISNVTDFGSLFTKRFRQLRSVIETTGALSFLINDYSNYLKGGA